MQKWRKILCSRFRWFHLRAGRHCFRRQLCEPLDRPRPIQKEVLRTHRLNPQPLDGNRFRLIAQHKRMIIPIADYEFRRGREGQLSRSSRSSVRSPTRPTSLREPHQPRAVPRVSNSPAVPHSIMRETRILNPGAKSRRLSIPVGNSSRIDHGEERVQRHELGWSGMAAPGSRGVFCDGRDEEASCYNLRR